MYQAMPTPIATPDFIGTAPTAISTTSILSGLQWKPWMLPWGSILLVFDLLSFVLLSWMYIAGCDAVLGLICGGSRRRRRRRRSAREQEEEAILRTLERWERQQWERWQRQQWARMDAEIMAADSETEEGDRLEDVVVRIEFALSGEERAAWERHRVVQAEMRRFGVV